MGKKLKYLGKAAKWGGIGAAGLTAGASYALGNRMIKDGLNPKASDKEIDSYLNKNKKRLKKSALKGAVTGAAVTTGAVLLGNVLKNKLKKSTKNYSEEDKLKKSKYNKYKGLATLASLGSAGTLSAVLGPSIHKVQTMPDFEVYGTKDQLLEKNKDLHNTLAKRAALGAGITTTAGLGGYHLYKYLKNRNNKDPKKRVTGKQFLKNLGKDALIGTGLGLGAAAGVKFQGYKLGNEYKNKLPDDTLITINKDGLAGFMLVPTVRSIRSAATGASIASLGGLALSKGLHKLESSKVKKGNEKSSR